MTILSGIPVIVRDEKRGCQPILGRVRETEGMSDWIGRCRVSIDSLLYPLI